MNKGLWHDVLQPPCNVVQICATRESLSFSIFFLSIRRVSVLL